MNRPSIVGKPESAGAPGSIDKPESAALFAGQAKSARDFFSHEEELADGGLLPGGVNLIKSYNEGGLYLVVRFVTERSPRKYDLVFRAIGVLEASSVSEWNLERVASDSRMGHVRIYRNKCGMSGVTQAVESPEGFIPTLVGLEGAKNRHDFIWHVSTNFVSDNGVVELDGIVTDRERCLFRFDLSGCDGGRVSSLVKSRAKVEEGVECDIAPFEWDGFNERDFVNLVNSIRIGIDEKAVWATVEESFYLV